MSIEMIQAERVNPRTIKITWRNRKPGRKLSIYTGDSPGHIDYLCPIAKDTQQDEFCFTEADPAGPVYFSLIFGEGEERIVSERRVPLQGALNFRDLGGYRTRTGKRVKWGGVFRSDALSRLTPEDHTFLLRMGLKTVCDFRSLPEVARSPDRLPENGAVTWLHLPVTSHQVDTVSALERLKRGDTGWLTETFMQDGYITNLDEYGKVWGTVINHLAVAENRPLVFHCTAGKDRTGTLAAILLSLLEVPDETIIQDHGLSNQYLQDFIEKIYLYFEDLGVNRSAIASYLTAPRPAITALLAHLRDRYGSAEEYLIQMAGVNAGTIRTLRRDLLE